MNFIEPTYPPVTRMGEILGSFEPISLEEMDSVKLLDRMDSKFIFHREQLQDILEKSLRDYRVLSIGGLRSGRYETRYFDTRNLEMYLQHHNGKLNRHKVRFRDYLDTGSSFFEIKFKTNKGRTIKNRVKFNGNDYRIEGKSALLLKEKTGYDAGMLSEALQVNYTRITLVKKNLTERLTIDLDLNYRMNQQFTAFPNLVIAEVKQDRASGSSFLQLMQAKHIQPFSMSKYCLGIASMNKTVKTNNFKPKLLYVNKLCNARA